MRAGGGGGPGGEGGSRIFPDRYYPSEGKTIITRISKSGDVLGLSAVISNRAYEVTAEMMRPGLIAFVPRSSMLQFMNDHAEVAMRVAEHLSDSYYTAHEEVRTLGLATDTAQKLARFLLAWYPRTAGKHAGYALALTHQEIGETIRVARQTVTRIFSEFRKRHMLQTKGSTLSIRNRRALEEIVHFFHTREFDDRSPSS